MQLGYRLDDLGRTFSWRDLHVIVEHSLKNQGNAISNSFTGVDSWSRTDHLLAVLINEFAHWKWAHIPRNKRRPFEPPILIPGSEPERQVEQVALGGVDRGEAAEWLAGLAGRRAANRARRAELTES